MNRAADGKESIDIYLATVPEGQRGVLEQLREQFSALYPQATEHVRYGQPLYKLHGHPLGGFYAAKHHCALYVWSGTALGTLGELLEGYDSAMSTIRFAADRPLPEPIVRAALEACAQEIEERWGTR